MPSTAASRAAYLASQASPLVQRASTLPARDYSNLPGTVSVGTLLDISRKQGLTGANQLDQARTIASSNPSLYGVQTAQQYAANNQTPVPTTAEALARNNNPVLSQIYNQANPNDQVRDMPLPQSTIDQNVQDTNAWNKTFLESPVYNPGSGNSYAITNQNDQHLQDLQSIGNQQPTVANNAPRTGGTDPMPTTTDPRTGGERLPSVENNNPVAAAPTAARTGWERSSSLGVSPGAQYNDRASLQGGRLASEQNGALGYTSGKKKAFGTGGNNWNNAIWS